MYGYRQSTENGMVTNLDSISSSISSIDTIGQPRNGNGLSQSNKTSVENLISQRSTYIGTNSTGLLWNRSSAKEDPYLATTASIRDGISRTGGSDIYCIRRKSLGDYCPNLVTTSNLILVPLLLLTFIRQVFDFLGQIWLQIIINFFTIIFIIVALFGITQNRISYLVMFSFVALFDTVWNLFVISIHFKSNDSSEDLLSLYSGTTSWWRTSGPGCLPYSISNIQTSINIVKSSIMSGCRMDYHLIEATQAAVHCALSFMALIICCWLISVLWFDPNRLTRKQPKTERLYRMNDLSSNHNKINPDPFPGSSGPLSISIGTNSLRRAAHKSGSRSSQHSMLSVRSGRRRRPSASDNSNNVLNSLGSRGSMQRSSKYGSLSSRRSNRQREVANDASSLTYGTTITKRTINSQRARVSSVSSTEYLPSYQPPHSSSANLLSPYGEISSIDSYNNGTSNSRESRSRNHEMKGNTNPVYQGSRSSVCSQNIHNDNYDDISYIYGGNGSVDNTHCQRPGDRVRRQKIYSQLRNGHNQRPSYPISVPEEIQVETYQANNRSTVTNGYNMDTSRSNDRNGSVYNNLLAPS